MKSFFFKGVFSLFVVLRGPMPRPRGLYLAPRFAPRTNALRARATYTTLLLSFAVNFNLAQAQQLSNRQYAAFKATTVGKTTTKTSMYHKYLQHYANHLPDDNYIANYQYYQFRGGITKRSLNYIPLNETNKQETNQEIKQKEKKKELKQAMRDVASSNATIAVQTLNQTKLSNATDLKLLKMQNKDSKKRIENKTTKSKKDNSK